MIPQYKNYEDPIIEKLNGRYIHHSVKNAESELFARRKVRNKL